MFGNHLHAQDCRVYNLVDSNRSHCRCCSCYKEIGGLFSKEVDNEAVTNTKVINLLENYLVAWHKGGTHWY